MSWRRLGLIIGREYRAIALTKSFLLTTILMPIVAVACIVLPPVLTAGGEPSHERVAVIDETGQYFASLAGNEEFDFEDITPVGRGSMLDFFNAAEGVYAVVVIPADVDSSLRVTAYSDAAVSVSLTEHVGRCVSAAVSAARVESFGIPELKAAIEACDVSVEVGSVQWNAAGQEERSSAELAMVMGMILSLLSYLFVMMYGSLIMSSVVEEKTSRIVEVIVSCCRPIELLLGKMAGVALAGLTQIAIWTVAGAVVAAALGIGALAADLAEAAAAVQAAAGIDGLAEIVETLAAVNYAEILTCFALYFVGGYMLYAAIFAAFGSAVDQQSEASQLMAPIVLVMALAVMVGLACVDNPDGDMALWCSMIPFTSPMVMMVRLPYAVPLWQTAVSLAVLYASAFALTLLASRVYRAGILMYGRKASYRDMLRWLRR